MKVRIKSKLNFIFIIGTIFFIAIYFSVAKAQTTDSAKLQYKWENKYPNYISELKKKSYYNYDENPSKLAWIKEAINRFIEKIIKTLFRNRFSPIINDGLIYLIFIVIVVAVFWFIRNNTIDRIFQKRSREIFTDDIPELLLSEQLDFHQLIKKAESENKFNLAIRYGFLQILQYLSKRNIINWEIALTNKDYIQQINQSTLRNQLNSIARIYEFVWYGERNINQTEYYRLKGEFNSLSDKILNETTK